MVRRAQISTGTCKRYNVRVYDSRETPGTTAAGTLVALVDLNFTIYADSGPDAEKLLENDVLNNKRARGRVYQLCPGVGNNELIRSIAFGTDGTSQRVFLTPTDDVYSELRRVRPYETITTPTTALIENA